MINARSNVVGQRWQWYRTVKWINLTYLVTTVETSAFVWVGEQRQIPNNTLNKRKREREGGRVECSRKKQAKQVKKRKEKKRAYIAYQVSSIWNETVVRACYFVSALTKLGEYGRWLVAADHSGEIKISRHRTSIDNVSTRAEHQLRRYLRGWNSIRAKEWSSVAI